MRREANARRRNELVPAYLVRLRTGALQLVCHFPGIKTFREILEQHHELIAAEARRRIRGPHVCPDSIRDAAQQLVTHVVAQRVVDGLEAIEVEEQDGELLPAAPAPREAFRQTFEETAAARETGQVIRLDEPLELLLRAFLRRDVR